MQPQAKAQSVEDAISAVLTRHLPADRVSLALDIWNSEYSAHGISKLVNYLSDLGKVVTLNQKEMHALRMDLYGTLYSASNQPAQPAQRAQQKPAVVAAKNVSPDSGNAAHEVFGALCQRLIEGAQRSGFSEYGDFCEVLETNLRSIKLPGKAQINLLAWASHKAELSIDSVSESLLPGLVNAFYSALCEALGPVDSDAVLSQAVRETEALPAAKRFSPRNLL